MKNKNVVLNFLKDIGWRLNSEDALVEIDSEQDAPADGEETPRQIQERETVQVNMVQEVPELPESIQQLDSLISEIGGFEEFAGLLLNAAELQADAVEKEEQKRQALVEQLVANSEGSITEEQLRDVETYALELMVNAIQPKVDYSVLGLRGNAGQGKDDGYIPAPSFFLKQNEEED